MAQHTLLPSLTALLPASTYNRFLSHVSLQSVHVEPYHLIEHVYTATTQVLQGQLKSLRIRQQRKIHSKVDRPDQDVVETEDEYEYSVVHLSNPLSGREYSDMSVRACTALDVLGCSSREQVEAFVKALGYQ